MPETWFTSDTHFAHRLVAGLRGFDSPEDHDEAVIHTWNKHVKPTDRVWLLGDVSLRKFDTWAPCVRRLNGHIQLVAGNHDYAHTGFRNANAGTFTDYASVFETVQQFARVRHDGRMLVLSHYPYDDSHPGDPQAQWRPRDVGNPVIHGHTHSTEKLSYSACGTPQLHVGWDAWRRPVRFHEIVSLLKGAQGD